MLAEPELGPYLRIVAGPEPRVPVTERRRVSRRWTGRVSPLVPLGIVFVVFGASLLAGMGHYASARAAPSWVGVVVVAGGVLTIGFGLISRKS